MSRIGPEVWTRLSGERVQGETLWARKALPGVSERLIAALDVDGKRHLLILLLESEEDMQDHESRGLKVATRELLVHGLESGRFLDVVCHDATGHEALDIIGGELADRLSAEKETAPEIVARVLAKWRRFWGQQSKQILSYEKQLGLFAELRLLSAWLVPNIGAASAVTAWRGPLGSRHDFEWPGRSIEAKATTSKRGRIHHINGLDQLDPPEGGELFLFSVQLREEGGAANTLPSIMEVCRAALAVDEDALSRFEIVLAQSGYSPEHESEYAKLRLRIIHEDLFGVERDFPRLTAGILPIPAGVDAVEYEVNLRGCEHLIVAANAAEMPELRGSLTF